tara:strand:+ start:428 stop:754 length:327 start_codon:yes stop_codon:yes gene_type:complete
MASKSTEQNISFGDVDTFNDDTRSAELGYALDSGKGFVLYAKDEDAEHEGDEYLNASAVVTGDDAELFVRAIQDKDAEIYRLRREIDQLKSVANQARALLNCPHLGTR